MFKEFLKQKVVTFLICKKWLQYFWNAHQDIVNNKVNFLPQTRNENFAGIKKWKRNHNDYDHVIFRKLKQKNLPYFNFKIWKTVLLRFSKSLQMEALVTFKEGKVFFLLKFPARGVNARKAMFPHWNCSSKLDILVGY